MRLQRESKLIWCLAGGGLFALFCLVCFNTNLPYVGDSVFLYNRCYQGYDCLRHGLYPFLYYEDCGGIGYGSPIFYGQLTLFPFIPLLGNISVFLKVYYLCVLLLNFFGFRCFLKRISNYATLSTCFYIFSMAFVGIYNGNIPACAMAVGFSWYFFAYCIDFFRDKRNFELLILAYFMIWQSNFNTTVIATAVCFGLFIVYFDKKRIKDYARLLVVVTLLIAYNIVNILVHIDAVTTVDPAYMLDILNTESDCRLLSVHPLGGLVFRSIVQGVDGCTGFMHFAVFFVFLCCLYMGWIAQSLRFKVCTVVLMATVVFGYVIGSCSVWPSVYKFTNAFFQFPIRYYVFLFGFVIAVFSRVIQPKWFVYVLIPVCVLDIFLVNPFRSVASEEERYVVWQLGNGEYASDDFLKDFGVYDEYRSAVVSSSGAEYQFTRSYNLVVVDCEANPGVDILTLPKLYYKGYKAVGSSGESFLVSSGYSNYCEIDIGSYRGVIALSYHVPFVVLLLFFVQVACVCVLLVYSLRRTLVGGLIYRGAIVGWFAVQLAVLWIVLQVRVAILLFWRKRLHRLPEDETDL